MLVLLVSFLIALWIMLTPGSAAEILGSSTLGLGAKVIWLAAVIFLPIFGSVKWMLS